MTCRVWERTFKSGEILECADVMDTDMEYLYNDGEFWHFMATDGSFEQHAADAKAVGDADKWLKAHESYVMTLVNGAPIAIARPKHIDQLVAQTDPGLKGDTAQGGSKPATMASGAVVQVPLFIEEGETLKIDTRTGKYISRA